MTEGNPRIIGGKVRSKGEGKSQKTTSKGLQNKILTLSSVAKVDKFRV
jgi:hypothetical protein